MENNYTFPAVFDYSEEGVINIHFPDIPEAFSCAGSEKEAVEFSQDVLALVLQDYEDTRRVIPEASSPKAKKNQKVVYINVWMPYHRSKSKETYVKKTLTIPTWLNILAVQNNLNFSQILVDALKEKLHLK